MKAKLIIGTRQSLLALWQSEHVAALLKARYPECEVVLKKIVTKGDKILDVPLAQIGGKGLFTKEIEEELLAGTIDLAVHSLKDLPTVLPKGLSIAAITERANVCDAFVSNKYTSFDQLPPGAKIGTSSLRRKAQLLAIRPDLTIVDLRGNVNTRLKKLDDGAMDAIILAAAGLERLGYQTRIRQLLPESVCLHAVGQGALAIETRAADTCVQDMLKPLDDAQTRIATLAERAFLGLVEGGCQVPIGVHAQVSSGKIHIEAIIATLTGDRIIRDNVEGDATDAEDLGAALGIRMLNAGGREILAAIL